MMTLDLTTLLAIACAWMLVSYLSITRMLNEDRSLIEALVVLIIAPPLAIAERALMVWRWCDSHAQWRTWVYYVFAPGRMMRSQDELLRMHRITLKHKMGRNVEHWLWRMAAHLYYRVNNWTPPAQLPAEDPE